jgi:HSP20 family molecular chaperone IbpA
VDVTRIAADFSNGLLTVTIPKAGRAGSRRIDIG